MGFLHVGKTSIINQMHALLSDSDDDNISHFSHNPVVTRFDYNNCYYDIWESMYIFLNKYIDSPIILIDN